LPADRGVGIDHDRDPESFLQSAQMRAFVIEQIKRDVGARAHAEIMRCCLEQHFLERTQQLERH
jgi:hypothetical protein